MPSTCPVAAANPGLGKPQVAKTQDTRRAALPQQCEQTAYAIHRESPPTSHTEKERWPLHSCDGGWKGGGGGGELPWGCHSRRRPCAAAGALHEWSSSALPRASTELGSHKHSAVQRHPYICNSVGIRLTNRIARDYPLLMMWTADATGVVWSAPHQSRHPPHFVLGLCGGGGLKEGAPCSVWARELDGGWHWV